MATIFTYSTRTGLVTTTDASPTDLNFPDVVSPSGYTVGATIEVLVAAVQPSTLTHYGSWIRRGCFTKDKSSNISLRGSVQTVGTDIESNASMNVTVKVLPTAGISVTVTGLAGVTLDWTVAVRVTQGGSS